MWGCIQGANFFIFLWGEIVWTFVVLNVFPSSSPKFPIGHHFFSYPFALSSTLVTYIASPKEEIATYLFLGWHKTWLICFKMGQSKMIITKKEKINWTLRSSISINMNHKILRLHTITHYKSWSTFAMQQLE